MKPEPILLIPRTLAANLELLMILCTLALKPEKTANLFKKFRPTKLLPNFFVLL